jgi:hypothetical protein
MGSQFPVIDARTHLLDVNTYLSLISESIEREVTRMRKIEMQSLPCQWGNDQRLAIAVGGKTKSPRVTLEILSH